MYIEYPKFYGKVLNSGESIEGDYLIGEGDRKFICKDKQQFEVDPWTVRVISKHYEIKKEVIE